MYINVFLIFFNWRIIALQCWVGFCHTSIWISHRYAMSPPSWTSFLPSTPQLHPTPQVVTEHQVELPASLSAKLLQSCLTLWPYRLQPTRLLCPWDSPGKNTGVGCMSSSRRSFQPRDQTWISYVSCIGKWVLYHESHLGRLEWVAISFSKESSHPRDRTRVSCLAGRFFTIWAIRAALLKHKYA